MSTGDCPTICIPCVSKSISQNYIFDCFNKLKLGNIKKINFINTSLGFKKVFIVFNTWFSGERELEYKKKLMNNETLYVEYNSGVWKCKNAIFV